MSYEVRVARCPLRVGNDGFAFDFLNISKLLEVSFMSSRATVGL